MTEPLAPRDTTRLYAETEAGSTVVLIARQHRLYQERFKTMFHGAFQLLAGADRPSVYYRVFFQGCALLDPVQFRRVSAREFAEASGMSLISAQRACAMLEADRVFLVKGKGSGKALKLNNRLCWASSSEKHNLATPDPEVIDARGR